MQSRRESGENLPVDLERHTLHLPQVIYLTLRRQFYTYGRLGLRVIVLRLLEPRVFMISGQEGRDRDGGYVRLAV